MYKYSFRFVNHSATWSRGLQTGMSTYKFIPAKRDFGGFERSPGPSMAVATRQCAIKFALALTARAPSSTL